MVAEFQKNHAAAYGENGTVIVAGQSVKPTDAPMLLARRQFISDKPLADDDEEQVLVNGERFHALRRAVSPAPEDRARAGVENVQRPLTNHNEVAPADLEPRPLPHLKRPNLPTCLCVNCFKLSRLKIENPLLIAQDARAEKILCRFISPDIELPKWMSISHYLS